ncbi:hypothetical protein COHA_001214 [Chlorella ohadii]|uniref:Uncharacterized protein n=1 Tax=Chlorella ohadii TaxID=2649997 RepID=A0AAD5DZL9_9CHLO|nr:hypothetical protein COHA_001214 [Chlorella ohadii]
MTSKRQIIITSNFKGVRPALVLHQAASQDLSPDAIAAGVASGDLLRTHIPFESLKRMPEGVKTYAFDMAAAGVEGRGRCDMAYGGYFHRLSESMLLEKEDGSKLTGFLLEVLTDSVRRGVAVTNVENVALMQFPPSDTMYDNLMLYRDIKTQTQLKPDPDAFALRVGLRGVPNTQPAVYYPAYQLYGAEKGGPFLRLENVVEHMRQGTGLTKEQALGGRHAKDCVVLIDHANITITDFRFQQSQGTFGAAFIRHRAAMRPYLAALPGRRSPSASPPRRSPSADAKAAARAEMEAKARALREEERRRKLAELEAQLIEEETVARVSEAVEARVAEALASEAVQQSLQQRLEEERRHIEDAVNEELDRERQAAEEAERQRREAIEQQKAELRRLEEQRAQTEAAAKQRQEAEEQAEAQRRFQELQAKMREAEERRKQEAAAEKERRLQKNNAAGNRPKFSFKLGA